MLDFVPNHTGLDQPWVEAHPEYYIPGTELDLARAPQNYTWVKRQESDLLLAHGRDPYGSVANFDFGGKIQKSNLRNSKGYRPQNSRKSKFATEPYGECAGLSVEAHPHMLRHACGFALADQGADTRLIQDYLGHRNIQHTVKYTATNPARFERLWRG
jgi:integrase